MFGRTETNHARNLAFGLAGSELIESRGWLDSSSIHYDLMMNESLCISSVTYKQKDFNDRFYLLFGGTSKPDFTPKILFVTREYPIDLFARFGQSLPQITSTMFVRSCPLIRQTVQPRNFYLSKLPLITHPSRPLKAPSSPHTSSSSTHTFSTNTTYRTPVSDQIRMEAKQDNQKFKLENLFNVKGKGNQLLNPLQHHTP